MTWFSPDSGVTWISESYPGMIAANDTFVFTFQQHLDFSTVNQYQCIAVVSGAGDQNNVNDTLSVSIIHPEPPPIVVTGLSNAYCINDPPLNVIALPPDGAFTGLDDLFDTVGLHEVTYSYYDTTTGCSGSKTFFIEIYPAPVIDLGPDTFAYAPVILDAGPDYSGYLWNNGSFYQAITAQNSGEYSVTVSNQYDCKNSDQVYVSINIVPPPWNFSTAYSYHVILLNEIFASDYTIDGVPISPGDYIGVFFVDSQGLLECSGYAFWNGSTTSVYAWKGVDADSGFEPGEEFTWKIYDASANIEYLATATYVPTPPLPNQQFFQVNGLSGLSSLTAFSGLKIVATDVKCHDMSDGAANLTVSVGSPPFSYLWSNGDTTKDITGISAGLYTVTVSDINNQEYIDSIFVYEPPALISIITVTDVPLFGTGSVNDSVSGGTVPYSFIWSNGVTDHYFTVPAGGLFLVTITDSNGCVKTDSAIVHENCIGQLNLTADINSPACHGESNGSAVIIVNSGVPPFSYLWSDGSIHPYIVEVPSGYYGVTVTDFNYCLGTMIVFIPQPDEITISPVVTDVTDFEMNNGTIDIYISGGTSPYTVLWSTGSADNYLSGLVAGIYSLTVTDFNLCTGTLSVTVANQPIISLSGIVRMGTGFPDNGVAILVHVGSQDYKSILFTFITNGNYLFTDLYAGKYLLYAIPDLNYSYNYFPHYFPTYFGDKIYWENSTVINLNTSRNDVDVNLFNSSSLNIGIGKISGSLSFLFDGDYEQNIYGADWFDLSHSSRQGGLARNIPILLLDSVGNPCFFTLTDENGYYSFDKLSFGRYMVFPEKPGYTTHSYYVSIDAENPAVDRSFEQCIIPYLPQSGHNYSKC
ncbi:MAG: hypothetical protein NTW49_06380 [Bacteroidia bacterium]|nr:hypothetical protein [Bacteroidia bacterium]